MRRFDPKLDPKLEEAREEIEDEEKEGEEETDAQRLVIGGALIPLMPAPVEFEDTCEKMNGRKDENQLPLCYGKVKTSTTLPKTFADVQVVPWVSSTGIVCTYS